MTTDTKCAEPTELLENLLARIHRDGGHHTGKVGLVQSCRDADKRVAELYASEPGAAPAEHATLTTEEREHLQEWLDRRGGLTDEYLRDLVARALVTPQSAPSYTLGVARLLREKARASESQVINPDIDEGTADFYSGRARGLREAAELVDSEPGAAPAEPTPDEINDILDEVDAEYEVADANLERAERAEVALAEARAEIERLQTLGLHDLEARKMNEQENAALRERVRELEAAVERALDVGNDSTIPGQTALLRVLDGLRRASTPAPAEPSECQHHRITGDMRGGAQCVDCRAPVPMPDFDAEPTPPSSGAEPDPERDALVSEWLGYIDEWKRTRPGASTGATPCPETAAHGVHACMLRAGHDGDCQWDTGATPEDRTKPPPGWTLSECTPNCDGETAYQLNRDDFDWESTWYWPRELPEAIANAWQEHDRLTADATAELREKVDRLSVDLRSMTDMRNRACHEREAIRTVRTQELRAACYGTDGGCTAAEKCPPCHARELLEKLSERDAMAELRAERNDAVASQKRAEMRAWKIETECDALASKLAEAERRAEEEQAMREAYRVALDKAERRAEVLQSELDDLRERMQNRRGA